MEQLLKKDVKETRCKLVDKPVFTRIEDGKVKIRSCKLLEFDTKEAALAFVESEQDRLTVHIRKPRRGFPLGYDDARAGFYFYAHHDRIIDIAV